MGVNCGQWYTRLISIIFFCFSYSCRWHIWRVFEIATRRTVSILRSDRCSWSATSIQVITFGWRNTLRKQLPALHFDTGPAQRISTNTAHYHKLLWITKNNMRRRYCCPRASEYSSRTSAHQFINNDTRQVWRFNSARASRGSMLCNQTRSIHRVIKFTTASIGFIFVSVSNHSRDTMQRRHTNRTASPNHDAS